MMSLLDHPNIRRPLRYIENFLWIVDKTGRLIPFRLNAVQRKIMAAKRRAIAAFRKWRFFILKARREGVTTLEQGISFHSVATRQNRNALTLAHTTESAELIFRIANTFYDNLCPEIKPTRLAPHNKRDLNFIRLNSLFFIGTAGNARVGRGTTLNRFLASEFAHWPLEPDEQADVLSGLTEACSHGEGVLETTAGNRGSYAYNVWQEAKANQNEWTPIFLAWWEDPTYREPLWLTDGEGRRFVTLDEFTETLTDEEKELMARHRLDANQIAWRRTKKRELKSKFAREYPEDDETCWLSSGTCYFDVDTIVGLLRSLIDYPRTHIPGGYEVRWEKPQLGVEYVIGCDTSEGLVGCDPNGLGVMRKDTGAQVAATHGLFNPRVLAEQCVRFSREYNNALVGIERQNHGHAVIQKVVDLGLKRPHFQGGALFFHPVGNKAGNYTASRAGWDTNSVTRDIMLAQLAEDLESGVLKIRDRDFLSECLSFKLQKNGRFEADPGAHDDQIAKWAICNQMRRYRKTKPDITILKGIL